MYFQIQKIYKNIPALYPEDIDWKKTALITMKLTYEIE